MSFLVNAFQQAIGADGVNAAAGSGGALGGATSAGGSAVGDGNLIGVASAPAASNTINPPAATTQGAGGATLFDQGKEFFDRLPNAKAPELPPLQQPDDPILNNILAQIFRSR